MRRAFTLIELLVVISITTILMTIIIYPIIQSFNMTRAAQGFADAQDKARTLAEKIAHEINQSAGVRPNSGPLGELDIVVPARPGSGSTVPGYDTTNPFIRVAIYNAKLDLVKPAEGDPANRRSGAFVNPWTGLADPTLRQPKGQPVFPASPGLSIVRYFVGLENPLATVTGGALKGYFEPYSGLLQNFGGGRDNLYVLWRAEVPVYIWSNVQNKYVVNKAYFYDQNRDADPSTTGPLLDDPTFFDPSVTYPAYAAPDPDGTPDPTKAEMVQNWLRVSAIQTEVSRYDMIQPVYDQHSRQVTYDGDAPRLMTLVQFRPTRVSSEPAEGQMAVRPGQESDGASLFAPDVYYTKYGGLANTLVRTFPGGLTNTTAYLVGHGLARPAAGEAPGFSIYYWDPAVFGNDDTLAGRIIGGTPQGVEIFDVDTYQKGLKDGIRFNFSRGLAAANSRSGFLGNFDLSKFGAYIPDANRGRINASFGIDERGQVAPTAPFLPLNAIDPTNPKNLPGDVTWPDNTPPLSPFNDPNLNAGVFSDAMYASVDKKFNKIWHDMAAGTLVPDMRPDVQRFIDLRVTPNGDGTPSPLDPRTGYPQAHIVPGSEQVFGPDQNPGPNYGRRVRYTRTTRNPGPNQYRINYVNLPEPDYSLLGLPNPPATYTATDFVSAVIQPRYRVGYLQLNSDPNVPLPGGDDAGTPELERQILVYYRYQFTGPRDTMAVDYDSRQLLSVAITIRNYPQSTTPNPQSVTLSSTATVRNFLR